MLVEFLCFLTGFWSNGQNFALKLLTRKQVDIWLNACGSEPVSIRFHFEMNSKVEVQMAHPTAMMILLPWWPDPICCQLWSCFIGNDTVSLSYVHSFLISKTLPNKQSTPIPSFPSRMRFTSCDRSHLCHAIFFEPWMIIRGVAHSY